MGMGVLRNDRRVARPRGGQLILVVTEVIRAVSERGYLCNAGGVAAPPVAQLVLVETTGREAVLEVGAACVTKPKMLCYGRAS